MCFFFQAEDGIRDLVRSRGLGDVYKRQVPEYAPFVSKRETRTFLNVQSFASRLRAMAFSASITVSYTHLTLPTSDLV